MKNIILKSSSPRRKELLTKLGYEFTIKTFNVDETMDSSKTPEEIVRDLGLRKASIHKEDDYGSVLIGCDTIVVLDNHIYGKPKSEEDAYNMLKSLSGKCHQVISGCAVIYEEHVYSFSETSNVYFRELTDEEIWDYIKTKDCFGKAGSYAIQGVGRHLIDKYYGSLNNIIGLPTEKLSSILGEINELED